MSDEQLHEEFSQLCDAVFEKTASVEQVRRLEELVLSSPDLKRQYVELSHLHASLSLMADESVESFERASPPAATALAEVDHPVPESRSSDSLSRRVVVVASTLLVTSAAFLAFALLLPGPAVQESFATLVTTDSCLWEASSVPIEEGVRIGRGSLQLAEGLAKLTFDSGAEVAIEGPARFEVLTAMRCRIQSGKLSMTIEEGAKGFVVETPNAILTDQGTSFGVNVSAEGNSVLHVFKGQVDVKHVSSGQSASVFENDSVSFSDDILHAVNEVEAPETTGTDRATRKLVQVSTAVGSGRDHWLQREEDKRDGPDDLLLVKAAAPWYRGFDRRAILTFDLSGLDVNDVAEATLQLTQSPTGLGYASRMPDATFAVFGMVDDAIDQWSSEDLQWSDVARLKERDSASLVGTFEIPQGQQSGEVSISGAALRDFLIGDINGAVTFVIVSKTNEHHPGALVHGFASGEHESLPPPTLRLWFAE